MPQEENGLGKELDSAQEKVKRLQEGLEPEEALEVLEEAVTALERCGERLEEAGS